LENSGTIDYDGSNLAFGAGLGQAGVIMNLAGGVIDVTGDGDFAVGNTGAHSIQNAGTFRKSAGVDVTSIGVPFINTNMVEVLAGTLITTDTFSFAGTANVAGGTFRIGGGGSAAGPFVISAGAVNLTNGTFTMQNGAAG